MNRSEPTSEGGREAYELLWAIGSIADRSEDIVDDDLGFCTG